MQADPIYFLNNSTNIDWPFWFLIIFFLIFVIWLFFGGGDYEYVGLSPLEMDIDSTKCIDKDLYNRINLSNRDADQISNICPSDQNQDQETRFSEDAVIRGLGQYKSYQCSRRSKGEMACKKALEEIFDLPFFCVRPDFLKNPETGRNLELDLYNDEVKIAVEFNGIQHTKWPNYTGQTKEDFIKQIRRDKFKYDRCNEEGIYLITVPHTVPENNIKNYILSQLPDDEVEYIDQAYYSDSYE